MTRIPLHHIIFNSTLSILLLFSHNTVHGGAGSCDICPNGIENPESRIPYVDGTVSCTQAKAIFSLYDRISCAVNKVNVVPICCPSQFKLIAQNNICGWCSENGTPIETLDTRFRGPVGGMQDATCADLIPGIALATETTGCSMYEYAEEYCCPQGSDNRDGPPGAGADDEEEIVLLPSDCHFCNNGVEFPSAKPLKDDERTCQEVADFFLQIRSALVGNEMACSNYRLLEYTCCPDSISILNPIGNGGEHITEDTTPKADDGQSGEVVDTNNADDQGGSNPSPTTSEPTSPPTGGPTGGPTAMPTPRPSSRPSAMPSFRPSATPSLLPTVGPTPVPTAVPSSSPSSRPTSRPSSGPTIVTRGGGGNVTIDTEVDEAVLAGVEDDNTNNKVGNTIIITDVDAGDMIFNDHESGVSTNKNTNTGSNDATSTGGDDRGIDYEIIYPYDHHSGSLRHGAIGCFSTIVISGVAIILLTCLIDLW